jgi:hypothetical protein
MPLWLIECRLYISKALRDITGPVYSESALHIHCFTSSEHSWQERQKEWGAPILIGVINIKQKFSQKATRSVKCSYSLLFLISLCQDTNWTAGC